MYDGTPAEIRRLLSHRGDTALSLRDSSIVVLEIGARRTLISREAAQRRAQDGLGIFDGNVKIHKSLDRTAIPDLTGHCRYCDEGACRPLRVSHMTSRAASHRPRDPWKAMRVKGNRRGQKRNFIAPIERELDPRRMAAELRELSSEHLPTGALLEKFGDPDKLVRELELERNLVHANSGTGAVAKLDAEREKYFVQMVERIKAEPGYARHIAEYVAKLRRLIFPFPNSELKELKLIVGLERAQQLQSFLDEITDRAAELISARRKAFRDLRERRNDPNLKSRQKNGQ